MGYGQRRDELGLSEVGFVRKYHSKLEFGSPRRFSSDFRSGTSYFGQSLLRIYLRDSLCQTFDVKLYRYEISGPASY